MRIDTYEFLWKHTGPKSDNLYMGYLKCSVYLKNVHRQQVHHTFISLYNSQWELTSDHCDITTSEYVHLISMFLMCTIRYSPIFKKRHWLTRQFPSAETTFSWPYTEAPPANVGYKSEILLQQVFVTIVTKVLKIILNIYICELILIHDNIQVILVISHILSYRGGPSTFKSCMSFLFPLRPFTNVCHTKWKCWRRVLYLLTLEAQLQTHIFKTQSRRRLRLVSLFSTQ